MSVAAEYWQALQVMSGNHDFKNSKTLPFTELFSLKEAQILKIQVQTSYTGSVNISDSDNCKAIYRFR